MPAPPGRPGPIARLRACPPARLAVQPPGTKRLQIHSALACLDGQRATVGSTGLLPLNQTVRLAHGRDARDVAFAIISGPVRLLAMSPDIGLLNRNPPL